MPDKLAGVRPDLAAKIKRILAAMDALGFPMMVTDGVRTTEQQQALYAQGRTKPGAIVTNADGILKKSNHQPHEDGLGWAVDCTFVINQKPSWDPALPWDPYGRCAKVLGLTWGGDWHGFVDRPHVEWRA